VEPTASESMSRNKFYYYDHEACTFVEVKKNNRRQQVRIAGIAGGLVAVALVLTLVMDQLIRTPQEIALMNENAALQQQLEDVQTRITDVAGQVTELRTSDENLYRSLLQMEPIGDDVRRVGVGGSDDYQKFNRFSEESSELLNETATRMGELERQIALQSSSFRDIERIVDERETALSDMPAILPAEGIVVSGYGMRFHPVLKVRRMHYGIDVAVWTGTEVVATGDGVVRAAGRGSTLGNYVKIEHTNAGYTSVYGHLSKIPKEIRRGVHVKRGDVIALSGNTGLSSAPHLHYEIHDASGRALNPLSFLAPSMTPSEYQKLIEETRRSTVSLD